MQSINLQRLTDVTYQFAQQYADTLPGEPFHPEYKKDKKGFIQIMKSDIQTERALKTFFRKQSKRVNQSINWDLYTKIVEREKKKQTFAKEIGDVVKQIVTKRILWRNEKVKMSVLFTETLDGSWDAGTNKAIDETGLIQGITPGEPDYVKAFENYTLDLAGDLTKETLKRTKEALIQSRKKLLDQAGAQAKVAKVIKDDYRAGMIAHTESVRSYSQGKLSAGERLGAEGKKWDDGQPKACPICRGLNAQQVKLDKQFKSDYDNSEHEASPAHPWCRCYTKLIMKLKK